MTATHASNVAPGTGRAHAPGAFTQATGLGLLALAPVAMFAVGASTGADLGEGVVFLVIGAILAVAAVLAVTARTWSKVVGLVLTVLAALGGFWLAFGLLAPTSPTDFVVGAMFVTGVVLSVAGGVQAIRRRGAPVTTATRGEQRARTAAIAITAVALVASLGTNLLTRTSVSEAAAEGASPVTMRGFEFATSSVTIASGEDARVLVSNSDPFLHDFAIPDAGIEAVTVAPGSQTLVDLSGLAAGTYTFYCTLHSDTGIADPEDAGMAGTLVVE